MTYGFSAFFLIIDFNSERSNSLYDMSSLRKNPMTFTAFFFDFMTVYC